MNYHPSLAPYLKTILEMPLQLPPSAFRRNIKVYLNALIDFLHHGCQAVKARINPRKHKQTHDKFNNVANHGQHREEEDLFTYFHTFVLDIYSSGCGCSQRFWWGLHSNEIGKFTESLMLSRLYLFVVGSIPLIVSVCV